MSTSFQNEIPKARVNITLNVETNGSQKKKELPCKLLILGKFNQDGDKGDFKKREKIDINKEHFNQVIGELNPKLEFTVKNHLKKENSELRINLGFKQLKDFHPEQIVIQISELRKLVAIRNLLKELKANLVDNKQLQKELERIISNKEKLNVLKQELKQLINRGEMQ